MTMILAATLFALFGAQTDLPPLPDWSVLGPLRYLDEPHMTEPMTAFVVEEYAAGRCVRPAAVDGRYALTLDVAVLIDKNGAVRATVPHAINCPTIEQYGAGLVSAFARDNLVPRATTTDQWFRTSIIFTWAQ